MRPEQPTFWLLDAPTGWRTLATTQVAALGDLLQLTAVPGGPLALDAPDGSLGGLILPPRLALTADGKLFLLRAEPPFHVLRFDPDAASFLPLPGLGEGQSGARDLVEPVAIASDGRLLAVADPAAERVKLFDLHDLALIKDWRLRVKGIPWEPAALAWSDRGLLILDRRMARVYCYGPGRNMPELLFEDAAARGRWQGMVVDRQGDIYLYDRDAGLLTQYALRDRWIGDTQPHPRFAWRQVDQVDDAGSIRGRFPAPPLPMDHRGRFCIPASLARNCGGTLPQHSPPPEQPLVHCPDCEDLVFDHNGVRVRRQADEPWGPAVYAKQGSWLSQALDSRIHRCQWHRIELALTALPLGCRLSVDTYSDDAFKTLQDLNALPEAFWQTRCTFTGTGRGSDEDLLVQSREGRYLWLRLRFESDGYGTPAIARLRVHYPRLGYLQYLPAVYAADEESRWFLERFLALFQTSWDDLSRRIADTTALFDPKAVPDDFVDYLAGWFQIPLEQDWSAEQKRRLLSAMPAINDRRGTPQGMAAYLQIVLWNQTGINPLQQGGLPALVEGWRERSHHRLMPSEGSRLGKPGQGGTPLWSRSVVGRFQTEVYDQLDEARLVATGDPERDWFHEHAHRFKVFLPAAWLPDRAAEEKFERALAAEKPAHTQASICLVAPRFRVGVQSTVGLDTLIGRIPRARLHCPHESDGALGRPPRYRLGYDTVLGADDAAKHKQTKRVSTDLMLR